MVGEESVVGSPRLAGGGDCARGDAVQGVDRARLTFAIPRIGLIARLEVGMIVGSRLTGTA